MAGGYVGKVLWVDLSSGKIVEEGLDEKESRQYIGGYGTGAKTLFDRQKAKVDPLGPENTLGILTGPLTGTPAIIGSRFVAVAKSPLTGTWGDANCGGYFGPRMKFAGVDGVYFTGKADKPVYLLIDDGKAELKDASHLWGKDTIQTRDWVKAEYGAKAEEACIGPAGEMQSLIACIINDYGRAAGRSGLGAVMGSKRLKAVVVRGDKKPPLANPERMQQLRKEYARKWMGGDYEGMSKYGTVNIEAGSNTSGDSPVKNWSGAGPVDFPTVDKIAAESVVAEQQKKYHCWQCTIGCGGEMKAKDGRAKFCHKPEYETICATGNMCLNDDLESIVQVNDIVNAYGLDSISAPCAIAFAIDCYEHGVIDRVDTDGLELTWGNAQAIVNLCGMIARREGFGAVLADGVRVAAQRIGRGAEQYAIHIQGQEVPMHDPRHWPGLAMNYQLDATPARHTQGGEMIKWVDHQFPPYDKYDYSAKGAMHKQISGAVHVVNSAGLCLFGYLCYPLQSVADFMTAATGWDFDYDEIFVAGERIANIRHAFNLREGLNPLRCYVPPLLLGNPPMTTRDVGGVSIDAAKQNADYLKHMAWDPETAMPSPARLEELGMADVARGLGL
ncbi:MAG: aldehyde ferredoxin oxidoreductase family protein [Dehalococcoidales bacterium]|nr:aldehyde ferredoxin oxidoreductase family protein [Dehalococcoidales bacterium]